MSSEDIYRELYQRFEKDLENRRTQNDNKDLGPMETAAVRGQIEYIKGLLALIREKANKGRGT